VRPTCAGVFRRPAPDARRRTRDRQARRVGRDRERPSGSSRPTTASSDHANYSSRRQPPEPCISTTCGGDLVVLPVIASVVGPASRRLGR
jgi:hypothetical protein